MKKILKVAASIGFLAASAVAINASAAVVTSLNGTALTMPAVNYTGTGPQTLAPGITWTSDYDSSVFGWTLGYTLASNGTWDEVPHVGTNDPTNTMTFTFDQAVAGFGGILNYAPGYGSDPVIAAYDANGNLLESFTLNISTPGEYNAGQFFGFLDQTADISSFTMTGSYIVGKEFVVQEGANVPEPASLSLLGLGLAGFAVARRKSSKR